MRLRTLLLVSLLPLALAAVENRDANARARIRGRTGQFRRLSESNRRHIDDGDDGLPYYRQRFEGGPPFRIVSVATSTATTVQALAAVTTSESATGNDVVFEIMIGAAADQISTTTHDKIIMATKTAIITFTQTEAVSTVTSTAINTVTKTSIHVETESASISTSTVTSDPGFTSRTVPSNDASTSISPMTTSAGAISFLRSSKPLQLAPDVANPNGSGIGIAAIPLPSSIDVAIPQGDGIGIATVPISSTLDPHTSASVPDSGTAQGSGVGIATIPISQTVDPQMSIATNVAVASPQDTGISITTIATLFTLDPQEPPSSASATTPNGSGVGVATIPITVDFNFQPSVLTPPTRIVESARSPTALNTDRMTAVSSSTSSLALISSSFNELSVTGTDSSNPVMMTAAPASVSTFTISLGRSPEVTQSMSGALNAFVTNVPESTGLVSSSESGTLSTTAAGLPTHPWIGSDTVIFSPSDLSSLSLSSMLNLGRLATFSTVVVRRIVTASITTTLAEPMVTA